MRILGDVQSLQPSPKASRPSSNSPGRCIDRTGNLPPLPGIFPDTMAPVVRTDRRRARADDDALGHAVAGLRAGRARRSTAACTNIRNVKSPHWRRWLGPEHRCLVPLTSFSEYDTVDGKKVPAWFAANDDRPLMVFAGIWTNWT